MLLSHGWRELAAAALFASGAALAPDALSAAELREDAAEEEEHFAAVARVWTALTGDSGAAFRAHAEARLRERPLPVPTSWLELALARRLFDRAGYFQIREYAACAYTPYRDIVAAICAEEEAHAEDGAEALVGLIAASPGALHAAHLARWLGVALLSFGRAGTPDSARAVALGLKARDPAAVMRDFVDDLQPVLSRAGLRLPRREELAVAIPPNVWPEI